MKTQLTLTRAAACFTLSSFAFGQGTVGRVVVEELFANEQLTAGPIQAASWNSPGAFVDASSSIVDVLALSGVNLTRVEVDASVAGTLSTTFRGLDPAGTYVFGQANSVYAVCGGQCSWGPLDTVVSMGSFGIQPSQLPLQLGESRTDTVPFIAANHSVTLTPASSLWSFVLSQPIVRADCSIGPLSWTAERPNGTSTSVEMTEVVADVTADVTIEVTAELSEVDTFNTCVSLPNGTGQNGRLRAYGSIESGSEWLTVRADRLPSNELSALFIAGENRFTAFATYNLCVGPSRMLAGGFQTTESGAAQFEIDLRGRIRGDSIYIQVFHRDPVLPIAATDAVAFFVE